jgi:hypothetical protein
MEWPEPSTSIGLAGVFVASFLISIFVAERAESRRSGLAAELEEWRQRDIRLQESYKESVDQQKALMKLLERQRAERKELEKHERELARRHREEYEELIRKNTA